MPKSESKSRRGRRPKEYRRLSPRAEPTQVARRAYRVNEFCDAYRVSRQTVYEMMKAGRLRYFHIGTERRIPVEAAEALANPPKSAPPPE
jgi:excisionase family DNA binding protein